MMMLVIVMMMVMVMMYKVSINKNVFRACHHLWQKSAQRAVSNPNPKSVIYFYYEIVLEAQTQSEFV
jgi:hypothetical protein